MTDGDGSQYMTVEMCRSINEKMNQSVQETLRTVKKVEDQQSQIIRGQEDVKGKLRRFEVSLYGAEEAGVVKGGLVHMVRDLTQRQGVLRWIADRLAAPIIVAVIVALVTLAVTSKP